MYAMQYVEVDRVGHIILRFMRDATCAHASCDVARVHSTLRLNHLTIQVLKNNAPNANDAHCFFISRSVELESPPCDRRKKIKWSATHGMRTD